MDYEDLKAVAPWPAGEVELPNGEMLPVVAMDIKGRLEGLSFVKENPDNPGLYFAYCAANGCEALGGQEPQQIVDEIDPRVVAAIGNKVLELSGLGEEASEEAEKNSESGPS